MNELQKLFEQAREGTLPPDFDRWEIADEWGISVAHVAAKHGNLPPDFDQWDLKDRFGQFVAHIAALSTQFPKHKPVCHCRTASRR